MPIPPWELIAEGRKPGSASYLRGSILRDSRSLLQRSKELLRAAGDPDFRPFVSSKFSFAKGVRLSVSIKTPPVLAVFELGIATRSHYLAKKSPFSGARRLGDVLPTLLPQAYVPKNDSRQGKLRKVFPRSSSTNRNRKSFTASPTEMLE